MVFAVATAAMLLLKYYDKLIVEIKNNINSHTNNTSWNLKSELSAIKKIETQTSHQNCISFSKMNEI